MEIYLPIAEMPVHVFRILAMGGAVGFISGLFGVGGGFLLTPLLIFTGIPPAVAVATVTPQIVASSTSGALAYWRRGALDVKLALVLFLSGTAGAVGGALLFAGLQRAGQLNFVIAVSYTLFLAVIGGLMLSESLGAIRRSRRADASPTPVAIRRTNARPWLHMLPLKVRFRTSRLYISILPVIALGASITFLGTLLGIGGGFIMVPALIYLLRVPTSVVVGTSLFQIVGTMAAATIMHALASQTVDILLAFILMIGGVMGAQFGAAIGLRLKAEYMRTLLGMLVLAVGIRFAIDLIVVPSDLYSYGVLTP